MSENQTAIVEAVTAILHDLSSPEAVRASEKSGWNRTLWSTLAESGFTAISVPEHAGGSGGDTADACAAIKAIAHYAAAVPVTEHSLLAGWALASAGLNLPSGPATIAVGHPADSVELTNGDQAWQLHGRVHRVPWARQAEWLVVMTSLDGVGRIASVPVQDVDLVLGTNLAGEPRDTAVFGGINLSHEHVVTAPPGVDLDALRMRGALARAASIAGALARVSDLTSSYTHQRQQFGRQLSRFQAVQRHVVRTAEHAHLAGMATDTAAMNANPEPDFVDAASAKIVAAKAATVASAAAHQAHGAIGMTKEYELGQLTRRLWSWRDEFGNESYWSRRLGRHMVAAGESALWPRLSRGVWQRQPTSPAR